jgi:deazaflavin-dependent oxidoreductase (nitroreductase family)
MPTNGPHRPNAWIPFRLGCHDGATTATIRCSAPMPISKPVAPFNKRVTHRVTRHIASWMPGFALVSPVGRQPGRLYRTPVNVFRDGDRYVFAPTYGTDSDWARNVLAAGGCEIETRRKTVRLRDPKRFTDATRHHPDPFSMDPATDRSERLHGAESRHRHVGRRGHKKLHRLVPGE